MKDFAVVFSLCLFFLSFISAEAKTKHQTTTANKEHLAKKQEVTEEEPQDSLGTKKITGVASWYSYKGGHFAASTEFKKGSVLRVINPANGKYIDVIVNDYGPSKKKHPNRVIDLDRVAFKKIAPLKAGLIDIIVLPLLIF